MLTTLHGLLEIPCFLHHHLSRLVPGAGHEFGTYRYRSCKNAQHVSLRFLVISGLAGESLSAGEVFEATEATAASTQRNPF